MFENDPGSLVHGHMKYQYQITIDNIQDGHVLQLYRLDKNSWCNLRDISCWWENQILIDSLYSGTNKRVPYRCCLLMIWWYVHCSEVVKYLNVWQSWILQQKKSYFHSLYFFWHFWSKNWSIIYSTVELKSFLRNPFFGHLAFTKNKFS